MIQFKQPTIWQQHRDTVLATGGVFATLAGVVVLLVAQIRRRKRTEAHLRDSEERLGFAAASAGIGLWQFDPKANRLWSSEHCRALFGVSSNHALSTSAILETVHPEDRQLAVASIRAATFGNRSDASSEFRIIGDNGGLRWLQARAQTTLDEKGKPARVSGIFRDITSYKAAQQEAEELSRRVMTIQDAERQRIAQELHDSTAQHIAAVSLNLRH